MRSMKVALHNVGLQLSPQEMCEALQQADLDGGCPNLCPLVLSTSSPEETPPLPTESLAWSCFKVSSSRKSALINTPIP